MYAVKKVKNQPKDLTIMNLSKKKELVQKRRWRIRKR